MERSVAAEMLGVSPVASPDVVREAFRDQVRANHPDRRKPGDTLIDLRELTEARDALLAPIDGVAQPTSTSARTEPPPTETVAPSGAAQTYQVDDEAASPASRKLREYRREGKPKTAGRRRASSRADKTEPSDRRSIVSVLMMLLVVVLIVLAFIGARAVLFGGPSCVVEVDGQATSGACAEDSRWEIVEMHDTTTASCAFPTERLVVATGVWCVVPHSP